VKGQVVLLEAVAKLRREGLELELVLVGDGPTRGTLEDAVARLELEGSVHLAGSVGQDDIRRYYADADIFCLPSFGEGLPVVLMEAMSMSLPVVATRIAGIPELVTDNEDGLLVTPARTDELASALRRLATDPELRRVLGDAGRTKVTREFDARKAADELAMVMATTRPQQ
jgi:glycosyltransferase involved in cell wall biosynthesis